MTGKPTYQELLTRLQELEQIDAAHKNNKTALCDREQFLTDIFDAIQDGISVLDVDLNVIKTNQWMERMYAAQTPLVGQRCYRVYQKRTAPCPGCPTLRTIESGTVHTQIVPYPSPDHPTGWIELSAFPVKDGSGNVTSVIEYVKDITEQKKTMAALKESEEKFRTLVEQSPLGISLVDKNGRYKYTNPQFRSIFGYTVEDIPNGSRWFKKAFPNRDYRREVIHTWLEDLKQTPVGQSRSRVFWVQCKDGSRKEIRFRPVTLDNRDQFIMYEDITEKSEMERQLRNAQKMEAIGTLAGGIAHDFNNLLMGIQGRTSLMMMDFDTSHSHAEHLKEIENYINSATDLTKQLLGYARRGKYDVVPIDLNLLIKKSAQMFGRTKKEIRVHYKFQKDLWAAEADQGQIEQVLLNIYVNAWQAMPSGGDIYLETQNILLEDDCLASHSVQPGRYVKISITDTGIGMDQETRQKIFDPFFTTKEMGRGTGLGLASAYGIIKNHDGIINVYSEKGKGTTFTMHLPASGKDVSTKISLISEVSHGTETVLLVDDEEMILNVGRAMLKKLGYQVIVAHNGEQAVEIISSPGNKIDLVILDMIMPKMDGGKTFERIREIQPTVPVLLSSGYAMNGKAEEIVKKGCNGFMQKPFTISLLSQHVRDILDETRRSTEG